MKLFSSDQWKIEIKYTTRKNHAYEMASDLKDSQDVIAACGGDGTVNEVGRALVNSTKTALAIVPCGSGNGLARSLGIPLDPSKALQRIKEGEKEPIDTCTFNDQPFFCVAGIGFDAEVAQDFDKLPTRGLKTYALAVWRQFKKFKKPFIDFIVNGRSHRGEHFMLVIANATQYGYGAQINPLSNLTDGELEIIVVKNLSIPKFTEFSIRLFLGTLPNFKSSEIIKSADPIVISSSSKLAHLDGEPIKFTGSATVKVHPRSLLIIH